MIDVIIPVYAGLEATRRCLESVLRTASRDRAEIVIVDDATPDERIARYVDELRSPGVTLLRNEHNLGFVRSVNRAMDLHADRDVILLNSDTEVANDWLARLCDAALSAANVATATPFSNNATICSYPFEGWNGGVPGTLGLSALDDLVARTNARGRREIPTAVGSCMFIRRAAWREVGGFDAERFGRGYGEENDFCMRASAAGWRHVLAADVFVFHEGAVSFGAEREALMNTSRRALAEAHPAYGRVVRDFIFADSLADLREAVDRARAARGAEEAHAVLAERSIERRALLERLHAAESALEEHQAHLARLHQGLAHATQIVEERTARMNELDEAIHLRDAERAKVEAALRHAETLAFERLAELDRIRRFWMWRFYSRALHWTGDPKGSDA